MESEALKEEGVQGPPRRRKGPGALKEEKRTNDFFSTFFPLSHIKGFFKNGSPLQ